MSTQKQKEAVYTAIVNVLSESGVTVTEGTDVAPLLTKELRAQVSQILSEGFKNGTIELKKEFNKSNMKAYVSSVQSNWIRKDKRLNGNIIYVAKNPNSRAGSGDVTLKAMKNLLLTEETEEGRTEIQAYIDAHLVSLKTTKIKAKTKTVNFDVLPEALKAKFQK